jgi:thiol-disulfide isomerase/thioredoxin
MRALAALLAVLALATGCNPERVVNKGGVDVDTTELRAVKEQAGIADCQAATGTGTTGLPDVTLPCLGGGPDVEIDRLQGPLVINLWAQWCEPCERELPYYQAFHEKYDGKVGVLGVDFQDTQPLVALRLAARKGVTYPSVADPDGRFRAPGLPRLILLGEDGKVAFDDYLEIKSLEQLEDLVEEHLGVTP